MDENFKDMDVNEWIGKYNELGMGILDNKYLFLYDNNHKESFYEMVERVCDGNEDIKKRFINKQFLHGGRIIANRGLQKLGIKVTFSNCYVCTPVEDNIEDIYKICGKLARTFSYGGGVGLDISKLAPEGAKVNNSAKMTTGAHSFMETFAQVSSRIGQHGRRGALMISMDCHHPDLLEFIDKKKNTDKITGANISVRVTDDFMKAVYNKEKFKLSFFREPSNELIEKTIDAYDVFHKLAENNWDYAEPGVLFWDRIKSYNMLCNNEEFEFGGVNPCAEQPLPAGGSCLLGSINLSEFVLDPFTKKAKFDFSEFKKCVHDSVIELNNVLEDGLSLHPLEEQKQSVSDWKQIGLGIMGLADMLIKLGIKYGSKESLDLCDIIGFNMADMAIRTSAELARDLGAYPKCDIEKITETEFFKNNTYKLTQSLVKKYGLRNSQLLTIAPTGSISNLIGISGGIEPIYANSYTRKTVSLKDGDYFYTVYTPIVKKYMEDNNLTNEDDLPDYFVTAMEIDYVDRINMQAVWQKHIDASISSTVNVHNNFTISETEDLYKYAYENGLKGITIFRSGSKREGVLIVDKDEKNTELKRGEVISVTDDVIGRKRKLVTGCGNLHCIALFDKKTGDLVETFLNKGSTGGCNNYMIGLSRLLSVGARAGVSVDDIVDQLMSTGICPSYNNRRMNKGDTSKGTCCPMAVGHALKSMYTEVQGSIKGSTIKDEYGNIDDTNEDIDNEINKCPQCGAKLKAINGCYSCLNCGWSKCD